MPSLIPISSISTSEYRSVPTRLRLETLSWRPHARRWEVSSGSASSPWILAEGCRREMLCMISMISTDHMFNFDGFAALFVVGIQVVMFEIFMSTFCKMYVYYIYICLYIPMHTEYMSQNSWTLGKSTNIWGKSHRQHPPVGIISIYNMISVQSLTWLQGICTFAW